MFDETEIANLQFERSVLSSLIFDPASFADISKRLTNDHFFLAGHQNIFNAIKTLVSADKPIDEEFIKQELSRAGCFDERVMIEILTVNPISNIDAYIVELAKFKDRRTLENLSIQFKKAARSTDPISTAKALIANLENAMSIDKRLPVMSPIGSVDRAQAEFILKDWIPIPKNTVSFITAPGGSGKSWIVLQMAARYCIENIVGKAFLWLSEDPEGLSAHRFDTIMSKVLETSQTFGERLQISNSPTPTLVTEERNRKLVADPIWHELKRMFDQFDLIILDPLIAFFGGDENNNGHARFFMQLFTTYAAENNKTIVFIHHSSKGTTGARGASAFIDAVRSVYEIDRIRMKVDIQSSDGKNKVGEENDPSKDHQRIIRLTKDNYGAAMIWKKTETRIDVFEKKSNVAKVVYEVKNEEKVSMSYVMEF